MGLSGRAHDRILRVARTVADLSGAPEIEVEHLAEALNYRRSRFVDR
jgi:magnesium chelatase family protein